MKNKIFYTFLSLLIFNYCFGQTHNKIKSQTKLKIDERYISLLKKSKVVGASIAIVDDGAIVYSQGYGFSDREKGIKADDKTIYQTGSCAKSFTALSIMQLHEKGKLYIKNSIKDYLPEFTMYNRFDAENNIYIEDILNHTSGIPSDVMNGIMGDAPPTADWLIGELNKQNTIAPRRYKQAYSNAGYAVLGEAIARVGEAESYSSYVKEHIFSPLKMTSSYINHDAELAKDFSKGYLKKKEYQEPLIRDKAAGMVHSNVLDMSNFMKMLLNDGKFEGKQIISTDALNEMEKDRTPSHLLPAEGAAGYGYGLGIHHLFVANGGDTTTAKMFGHNGNTLIYHANYKYIPELKVGVVILTNTDTGPLIYNGSSLLDLYLIEEKGISIEVDDRVKVVDVEKIKKEKVLSFDEYQGFYAVPSATFNVQKEGKVKFKIEGTKIVLKKKKEADQYSFTAKLLGFIPIKIKELKGSFVKYEGQTYFRIVENNQAQYMGVKIRPKSISRDWKNANGKYKRTGKLFPCKTCTKQLRFDDLKIKISEENGFILLETFGKSEAGNQRYYLDLLSEKNAVTLGIGRNSGITVKILENGNIYFDGFEFLKNK
ncbi:MAG: serine hydrolase domain-containing protein [Saprospiraceae bacterium]